MERNSSKCIFFITAPSFFLIASFVLILLIVFRRYLRVEDVYARG